MRYLHHCPIFLGALLVPFIALAQDLPPVPDSNRSAAIGESIRLTNSPTPQSIQDSGIDRLKNLLNLDAAQQSAWLQYVASIDAYTKLYYNETPIIAFASESGAKQVSHMVDTLQNRLAALEAVETEAKKLYGVLSTAQKAIADHHMVASIPNFGSAGSVTCPEPGERKMRNDRNENPQRSRRGAGGMPSIGGM